jgi:hypothetical protein
MPTKPSSSGVTDVPPNSRPKASNRPARMSSNTTVISSSTAPMRAAAANTKSSTGIVIIRCRSSSPRATRRQVAPERATTSGCCLPA